MVVRIERNFSLVSRCFVICCILFSISVNKLCAASHPGSSSAECEQYAPVAAGDGQLSSEGAKQSETEDTGQWTHPGARGKRQSNGGALVGGKPVSPVATEYVSNSENRGSSDSVKKKSNRKSQTVNYSKKNDSITFPSTVNGVNTRTLFGKTEENLKPTIDEIKQCRSAFVGGAPLCNATSNYPKSFVKDILKKKELASHSFGDDLLQPVRMFDAIETKFQDDLGYKTLCASREFLHYPRLGKTATDEWRYIVQSDDSQEFVQGIRVEVCVNEHQKCDLVDSIPNGYSVQCIQKFIYRRLLAISPDEKAALPDNFEFPSCCVCAYKSISDKDLKSRNG